MSWAEIFRFNQERSGAPAPVKQQEDSNNEYLRKKE